MLRFLLPAIAAGLLLSACAPAPQTPAAPAASGATVTCNYRASNTPAKPVDPPSGTAVPATGTADVTLTFASGPVLLTLDQAQAPCTTHSFESLAEQGFFTDTLCHRLVTEGIFVLQCGDPSGKGTGGPGYWFDDELAHTSTYPAGTLAMANAGPNTNGSQFFIVFEDSPLPPNYTVFGKVDAAGLQVVRTIAQKGLTPVRSATDGTPLADVRITAVAVG